jgi:DNA-directed RNA polymerase subunit RPC12/RpoP
MKADSRPYLTDRRCGRCLVPFEITEHREGGWLFATYACPTCGNRTVVTFSPQELQERERRSRTRAVGAGL